MSSNKYIPVQDNNNPFSNVTGSNNIMLEPRLQEYMKKRKYYKDNNINPTIPLEKEFSISNTDKKLLKLFLNGNTNVYKQSEYEKIISQKKKQQSFPSTHFKEDSRVLKMNKPDNSTPINRGMFVPENKSRYYEDPIVEQPHKITDSRDFTENNFKKFRGDINELKFNPRVDPKINPGFEEYDKCESPYRVKDGSCYDSCAPKNKKPYNKNLKNNYNDYNNDPHQSFFNYDLVDNYSQHKKSHDQDKFKKSENGSLSIYDRNMDPISRKHHVFKDQKIAPHPDSIAYNSRNFDADLESELIRGMPATRPHNKSYGYRDTFENHFDYIDDDFQNPDNTDIWIRGGEATRLDNKFEAKNRTYVREIM
jgi:hypothetical protein